MAGSRVVVPSLAGSTALQAWKRLTGAGLRVKDVRPVDGRPGVVVRTSPAPNASVHRGSAVVLYIGSAADRTP
jgi:beta-lactam-binding protein with PASTA domain